MDHIIQTKHVEGIREPPSPNFTFVGQLNQQGPHFILRLSLVTSFSLEYSQLCRPLTCAVQSEKVKARLGFNLRCYHTERAADG